MRILLFMLAVFFAAGLVGAQENETKDNSFSTNPFANYKESAAYNFVKPANSIREAIKNTNNADPSFLELKQKKSLFRSDEAVPSDKKKDLDKTDSEDHQPLKDPSESIVKEKFHWKPALIQSGVFLGIQHAYRMTQGKTRREMGGPFFRDWGKSVKGLRGWNDPDSFFINYVLHPLQGGLTGRIFVVNSDRAKRQTFGKSKEYWNSRLKAFVWSAAWSTQFELGPFSEASLGNVGIREKRGRSTMAYVDLVVTPVLGTGVVIAEDAIDKYILRNRVERKARKTTLKIRILRSLLTPTTSISNMLRGKVPWKRDNRNL
jgi:hypothetical protein